MKHILKAVLVASAFVVGVPAANAISEAEIKKDIEEFQNFFLKRFPGLTLADYSDGVNALPQYCLLYTSPSPRDRQKSRMPSSA